MFKSSTLIQFVCIGIIGVAVAGSAAFSSALAAEAGRAQLSYTDTAEEGDPPEVAVAIAFGAFRGLFVNYLWLRANSLKEDGKYYEAMELSSLITRLQPRFPRVWAFHAWNMAYNISVATKTREERWQWVKAGIDLLQQQGIPANPNDILLHKELSWIYFHKIGGFADDANRYYKKKLAEEWTFVLGEPPSVPENYDEATRIMAEWFEPVATAPATVEGLIQRDLDDLKAELRSDQLEGITSEVEALIGLIREEVGLPLDLSLLRVIAYIDATAGLPPDFELPERLGDTRMNDRLREFRLDSSWERAWDRLLPFIRRQVLVERYRMEPGRMLRYTREIGPLDWRHCGAHAIYWSRRGVEVGLTRQSLTNFNTVNTDRNTIHSVQQLFRDGTIFYDLLYDEHYATMSLNWAHVYSDIVDELIERNNTTQGTRDRAYNLFSAGHENFLKDVVRVYYRLGDRVQAQYYYDKLVQWEGLNLNNPMKLRPGGEYTLPLDEFVRKQLRDRLQTPHVVSSEINAALEYAFLRGVLGNDPEVFASQISWAHQIHRAFWEYQDNQQFVNPEARRMELPPRLFSEAIAIGFLRLVVSGLEPLQSARVYAALPDLQLQQIVYDRLVGHWLRRGYPPQNIQMLFPEPPNMEQHRAMMQAREQIERGRRQDASEVIQQQ
ncbi:MAG: hypothetical protein AAGI30_07325 [Planctomycetota bacterium]